MIKKEYIKSIKLSEIKPYEKNAYDHKNNAEHIQNSIKDFTYTSLIELDEDNNILVGHGRYEALKALEEQNIAVLRISGLTEIQKVAYRHANNSTQNGSKVIKSILEKDLKFIGEKLTMGDYGLSLLNDAPEDGIESVLGSLEDGAFSSHLKNSSDVFTITMTFPKEKEESITQKIKENGKQYYIDMLMRAFEE